MLERSLELESADQFNGITSHLAIAELRKTTQPHARRKNLSDASASVYFEPPLPTGHNAFTASVTS